MSKENRNINNQWIEIFRTGSHKASSGQVREFSEATLDRMIGRFLESDITLNHPKDKRFIIGKIKQLRREGKSLLAKLFIFPEYLSMIGEEKIADRSLGLRQVENGEYDIDHLAFLVDVNPALALAPLEFSNYSELVLNFSSEDDEDKRRKAFNILKLIMGLVGIFSGSEAKESEDVEKINQEELLAKYKELQSNMQEKEDKLKNLEYQALNTKSDEVFKKALAKLSPLDSKLLREVLATNTNTKTLELITRLLEKILVVETSNEEVDLTKRLENYIKKQSQMGRNLSAKDAFDELFGI